MDKDVKITLSLFLTWFVFGLFNLFGQPQAFVPPIIVDGLMVAGLGIYFCVPLHINLYYLTTLLFTIFILTLSSLELGWIILTDYWYIFIFCNTILLSIIFIFATVKDFNRFHPLSIIGIIVSVCFTYSFLIPFFPMITSDFITPIYIYGIGAFFCLSGIIYTTNTKNPNKEFQKVLLLFLLNFLFDVGNFLALLALS